MGDISSSPVKKTMMRICFGGNFVNAILVVMSSVAITTAA